MLSSLFVSIFRSLFIEMGKAEKSDTDICCPLKMKTGIRKKYVKKWGMRGEVEKETPKKWLIDYFYEITHETSRKL